MAINFPNSPTTNETHTASGKTWKWDGTSWNLESNASNYTLPIATASALGGIKIGDRLTIDSSTGVLDADVQSGGGGISDGDKGDITVSASGATWNIDADTVGTTELSATGTADATTYLRGDNTWQLISGIGGGGGGSGLQNIVEDTTPQLGGTLDTNNHGINFADNVEMRLGTGNGAGGDGRIKHDGSKFLIDNPVEGTIQLGPAPNGHVEIWNNTFRLKNGDGTKTYMMTNHQNAKEISLYFDGNKTFETTSDGIQVFNGYSAGGKVSCHKLNISSDDDAGNDAWIQIGSSADLKLYHDSTDSYINNITGALKLVSPNGINIGGLTYPQVNGSPGEVLTSDGSGGISWQSSSSSGSTVKNITVTVSTAANGQASGVFYMDGVQNPPMDHIERGVTYVFDQADSSNETFNSSNHPLMFSAGDDGDHNGNGHYMTGIQYKLDGVNKTMAEYVSGFNAATDRTVTWVVPTDAPDTIYYWCHHHTNQGNSISINNAWTALPTFTELTDTPSSLTADKWLKVNAGGTALEYTNEPTDTTYSNVTTSAAGLVPILPASSTGKFFKDDGTWTDTTDTTYSQSSVADSSNVKLRLSDGTTDDDILLSAGTNVTFSNITAAGFTINSAGGGSGGGSGSGPQCPTIDTTASSSGWTYSNMVDGHNRTVSVGAAGHMDLKCIKLDNDTIYEFRAAANSGQYWGWYMSDDASIKTEGQSQDLTNNLYKVFQGGFPSGNWIANGDQAGNIVMNSGFDWTTHGATEKLTSINWGNELHFVIDMPHRKVWIKGIDHYGNQEAAWWVYTTNQTPGTPVRADSNPTFFLREDGDMASLSGDYYFNMAVFAGHFGTITIEPIPRTESVFRSIGGGISDGDKGDITVSNSGATWNIDSGTVGTTELSATGTKDATTYLRGDNTWATVSGATDTTYDLVYTEHSLGSGSGLGNDLIIKLRDSNNNDDEISIVSGPNVSFSHDTTNKKLTISSFNNGISDGDKGDISVTNTGAVWSIDNDVIEEKHINAGGTVGANKVLVYDAAEATNWKWADQSGSGGGATDKIEEDNSSVEVVDSGSNGKIALTLDGNERYRFTDGVLSFASGSSIRMTGIAGGITAGLHMDGAGTTGSDGHGRVAIFGNTGDFKILDSTGSGDTNMAVFTKNDSVDLYFNGTKRLETASSGINVVGTTTTGQLNVTGVSTFVGGIKDKDDSTGTPGQVLTSTAGGLKWDTVSGGSGGANVTTDDTAPSTPSDGDLWWDSVAGELKIYYQDADSSQWVDAAGSIPSSTHPTFTNVATSSINVSGMATLGDTGIGHTVGIGSTAYFGDGGIHLQGVLKGREVGNKIRISSHIIPESNAQYDLGNAEYKIRHLFLSDNSIKFVSDTNVEKSLGVDSNNLMFDGKQVLSNVVLTGLDNNDTLKYNGTNWVNTPIAAGSFTGLTGTPSTYTADKWLKVNSGGTALEYTDAPSGGGGSPGGSANQLQINDGSGFAGCNLQYDSFLNGSLAFHDDAGVFGSRITCYHSSIGGGDSSMLFYVGGTTFTFPLQLKNTGGTSGGNEVYVNGTLSKAGGSFRIPHPVAGLTTTKDLVHSFIEGPQMDLIYRGTVALVAGIATVNLDTKAGMTEGTFEALNRDVQCFTSNETGWTVVKGSVTGNKLTIQSKATTSTDTVSWMVVGERQDATIKGLNMTDADGNLIVEPNQTSTPTS